MRNPLRYRVWYTTRQRIVTGVVVGALVTGAGWYGVDRVTTPEDRSCVPGVARPAGSDECVGVSGTGYDFGMPNLTEVAAAIGRENRTLKAGEYATVALLLPLTSPDPSMGTKMRRELQGAFAEQYRANHLSNAQVPKIRLVLANTGKNNVFWEPTVDRLKTMTDAPDHLRAVSGVATSSSEVKRAVRALTKERIAVVGTTITADDIANGPGGDPFPGLARVSPTNRDEARALAQFGRVEADKALLVEDTRTGDHYTDTLKAAFTALVKGTKYEPQLFSSPPDATDEGTTSNTFKQITHLICDTDAETVFFAGRHTQLRQFINELGRRGCQNRAFTVLTGDEGSYLGGDEKLDRSALTRKVTVRYASLAHPDAWVARKGAPVPETGGSAQDFRAFEELLARVARKPAGPIGPTGRATLTDGQVIIAYDAMATAVHGIRQATPEGERLPTKTDVGNQWPQVKSSLKVAGASGWICLDNHGNPYNKAVPVVELTKEGVQRFVEIAWPEGHAPDPRCLPPSGS